MDVTGNMVHRDTKAAKVASGKGFIRSLPVSLISFAGIAGSVSYDPKSEDDIDIFIITRQGCLWLALFYALLMRRLRGLKEICLSLCMDDNFAHGLFSQSLDKLAARDALRVIPVLGSQYYLELLQLSPLTRRNNYIDYAKQSRTTKTSMALKIANAAAYLFVGTYQQVKCTIANYRLKASGKSEERFDTRMGLHHFFLDSLKYHNLREGGHINDT